MMPETKFSFKKMSRCSSRKEPRVRGGEKQSMGRGKRRDYMVNKGERERGVKRRDKKKR